jgi:toxin ParE1/3/4
MPRRVRRWPQAKLDQYDIWLSIAEDSVRAADSMLADLDRIANMLADYPDAGPERNELGVGLRYYPSGSYLLFYTISEDFIEIRRIMHGAREITSDLFEH